MRALSPSELLDAWERGASGPAATRTLPLLAAASAGASADAVAAWSIGDRDRRLLTLREWTFGSQVMSVAECPGCREPVEWSIDVREIGVPSADDPAPADHSIESAGYTVRFRLPNTLDVAAAARTPDVTAARRVLLERCLVHVDRDGCEMSGEDLPPEVAATIAAHMGRADPGADTDFALTCPVCSHHWTVLFDIEAFFWSELSAWAQRILKDVHALAAAYGWREADILSMGPRRRQAYLGLIGA